MTERRTIGPERTSSVRVRGVPAWAIAAIRRLAVAAQVTPAQAARLALVRGLLAWGEAYPSLALQATPEEEDDDPDEDDITEREVGAWGAP